MKQLIRSLVASKFDEIVEKSVLHCHTRNVHSILFTDKIRMFYAGEGHTLGQNSSWAGSIPSVAYHPHHCNLDIVCNTGVICNRSIMDIALMHGDYEGPSEELNVFSYESGLSLGLEPIFNQVGNTDVFFKKEVWLTSKEGKNHLYLPAKEIHTIYVNTYDEASWFVIEGHEDPDYSGLSYHPTKPIIEENLYVKPTSSEVLNILFKCGLV